MGKKLKKEKKANQIDNENNNKDNIEHSNDSPKNENDNLNNSYEEKKKSLANKNAKEHEVNKNEVNNDNIEFDEEENKENIDNDKNDNENTQNDFNKNESNKDLDFQDNKKIQEEQSIEDKKENKKEEELILKSNRGSNGTIESEIIKLNRTENSNKLRKQILKMQNKADKYVEKFYKLSESFQDIKNQIQNNKFSNIFNAFSMSFGLNLRMKLKKTNFFVLACEAWIIQVFQSLEKYVKINLKNIKENENKDVKDNKENLLTDYPANFTFSSMIKKIANLKIPEESYLFNLSILTGSIYTRSSSTITTNLIENNIGKLYLHNINKTLKEFVSSQFNEDDELDQRKFENFLMEILRKAVEKSLNSMDIEDESSTYIGYLHCLEKLREESKENMKNFNLKNYIKILETNHLNLTVQSQLVINEDNDELNSSSDLLNNIRTISKDFSFKICAETFFDFSNYKISNIIDDIKKFIKEYNSINLRLKTLFEQTMSCLVDYNKKSVNFLWAIYNGIINKFRSKIDQEKESIEKLYVYYHKKFPVAFDYMENKKEAISKTYINLKSWINSTYDFVKISSSFLIENFIFDKYKLMYSYLIHPIYSISNSVTNNVTKLIKFEIIKSAACTITYRNSIMRFIHFLQMIIKQIIVNFYERTVGKLNIKDKTRFLTETNDENLFEILQSEDKEYIIVKINQDFIGNILYKLKKLPTNFLKLIFQLYSKIIKIAYQIPKALVIYSNKKRSECLDFLKSKLEEIIEIE